MIGRIIHILGIFLIISFSALCILIAIQQRDLPIENLNDRPILKAIVSLPSTFEDRFYDYRMRQKLDPKKVDKRIILAKMDDASIKSIGRWPWTRTVWSKFIRKMNSFGAKIIAFDVFFSEEEKVCNAVSPDLDLAAAISEFQAIEGNKILLSYSTQTYSDDNETFSETPEAMYNFVMDTKQDADINLNRDYVAKTVYPVSALIDADVGLGHIQANTDLDGIFRHYKLVANIDELYFPAFALLAYQYYSGDKPKLNLLMRGDATLQLASGNMNVNTHGETKVRWLGAETNFPDVAVADILAAPDNDHKMRTLLAGNIVFVGATAFGLSDLRHSPVAPMLPGVYFHMNITNMLLDGHFFKSKDESTKLSWLILLVGTGLMILIQLWGHAIVDLLCVAGISIGLYLYDINQLTPGGYEIKLAFCLFSIVACYSWTTFLNFYSANKDKRFLKSAFGNYISPELIDRMYKTGEPPKLGGDVGIRTAYFTDIQGFSSFSEKLSATKLVELLNEYLTRMTDILLAEGGTLDKYEGDAIIAFFGAPLPLEDHAHRALRVALKMQIALKELRQKWRSEGDKWPTIVHNMRMRIGINSGEIVTGNMGSASRMNYTMMGDSVNLAARLESSAKQYGIFIQVAHYTQQITSAAFDMRELDTIRVVGKTEPITTYELLGEAGQTPAMLMELKHLFKQGIDLYKKMDWDRAIEIFQKTLEIEHKREPELIDKANPSSIYIERCEEFKKTPPPANWDGVYNLTSK
ncbi:MAG: hypothetical protein A2504_15745 [Bdellovibrionales bacterium RIFOXYD12_FULL_39_22]|nr:MAG: hypothetical protein A2385_03175 [Bdellovibrionales bacterium RIFOXYB1_FULL_39_21]OFZ43246.1 MAG: hypothetical protein A2485_12320 [Bdellovibrionales bacterium RIFOXYC12_FULL_39_17]OFZ47984.1 MAG: hypothetical protein A2404_16960 [Bdellovibrionales bacterium RIFOXYC1_FULL_39_130]OFZ75764.1 MAG: hypothetical protein A2560_13460 [Bdellovibrionales bacterium RIFOXYD1_FULL_39_84]OFZ94254.1 MAG: hypothetical protein A2504_15745 [Bdellovibrionales bacterium RIFOXYD12_FULL_39_22]HLE11675.1 ad